MSSSAEVIVVAFVEIVIYPSSPEGKKLAAVLKAAAEVHKQRGDVKYKDMDKLAGRQPVGMTKSGALRKSDVASRKRDIKGNIGLEEAQEMEQISESFRRYTKILKD
jgi:non-canonical (house-cleaning) NTP pyrophosphatase